MNNKEYGSDFNLTTNPKFLNTSIGENTFLSNDFSLFFSGRSALYNLLKAGIENYKWQNIYVPGFYCHEVVDFIRKLPVNVVYYDFNPFVDCNKQELYWDDINTNVVINVFYFGIKKLELSSYSNLIQIEDLTHCISQINDSTADYCFGSLRKELPIPTGGFCSSPKNHILPSGESNYKSEQISIEKLTAMNLKTNYLAGKFSNKDLIRNLFGEAENKFKSLYTNAAIPQTSKAILDYLNCEKILEAKCNNIKLALSLLKSNHWFTYNLNSVKKDAFGLIINCINASVQSALKNFLIFNNIYPAVLWPSQIMERDIEVENKILFVHLDFRYDHNDVHFITTKINEFKYDK